jgi:hypothetical protein
MRSSILVIWTIAFAAVGWLFLGMSAERTEPTSDDVSSVGAPVADSETRNAAAGREAGPTDTDNVALKILREAASGDKPPTRQASKSSVGTVTVSDGPWGLLQSYNVYIAAPDHIVAMFQVPSAVTVWNFLDMSEQEVIAVLDRPDIPEEIRKQLTDRSRWSVTDGHVHVTPSNEVLLAIPPVARAAIYGVLAKSELNEFQNAPYFVPDGDVDEWLANAGLRTELVDVVRRTTYPLGRCFCFSDVSLVVALTTSHSEARTLIKALSRSRTAILRLRLDGTSNVRQVAAYWSSGEANAKDFLPLLESIETNPLVDHLDIVHLLPPYARKLLYTYPHQSLAVGGRYPDCHWTTLNFFNYRPEGRFFDADGAKSFLGENYVQGARPYRYGDALLFMDEHGRAVHSCIYLADDYVFTKNGVNMISPWLIMKLREVVDLYSVNGDPTIKIYRNLR